VIEADAVEAVLQGEHALDLMRLDHGREHVAHLDAFAAARQVIGHGEDAAQVVRRVTPLRRQPGVVEIQPADHGADVEGRIDRIELVGRARHACPAAQCRARHHRSQELGAGRVFEARKPHARVSIKQ
jgi:hypothetical protein